MGAHYNFKCTCCDYSFSTSGPWEFYRNAKGKRKPFGHPVPVSKEAAQRGIYGLSADLYCPQCDRIFDVILVEFKRPSSESLAVWLGKCEPKEEYQQANAVNCPACKSTDLILEPSDERTLTCPRCRKGKITGIMDRIS